MSRDKNKLITSVYCKTTFSGVFSHFDSFNTRGYKINLQPSIDFNFPWLRGCSICCSMELVHKEIMQLQEIFEKIGHGNTFYDRRIQTFLNISYKVPQYTVPKKDI